MKSIHESDDSNYSRNGERMHPEKNPPIRKMTADELRRRYEKELRAMDRNPFRYIGSGYLLRHGLHRTDSLPSPVGSRKGSI